MASEVTTDREQFLLELPEPKDRVVHKDKPYVKGLPDTSTLNDDQRAAFEALRLWMMPEDPRPFAVMNGFAGTGKTYTLSQLVHEFLGTYRQGKVCLTAPTNKAVRILREAATYWHTHLEYNTVHSMMAMKESIKDGKVEFVRDKNREPSVQEFDFIIVDEASMLDDELFELILNEMEGTKVKLLFVGDPCQIPPVGRVDCIPFKEEEQQKHDMLVVKLTKIVRQAEGNPLIQTTLKVRNGLRKERLDLGTDAITEDGGVVHLSSADQDDLKLLKKTLRTHFTSENFTRNPDHMKIVAWTNNTVNGYNDLVRGMLYGKNRKLLEVGERLIANTPIMRGDAIQHNTNDELLVKEYTIKEDSINEGQYVIKYYEAKVEHLGVNGATMESVIWVVHEDSLADLDKIQNALAWLAKKEPKGSVTAGQKWKEFFNFKRRYADVKYNYAITAHKSQGSTYDNVIVMAYDITKNRNVVERNRILYTACSRPRKKLIVVGW